VVKKQKLTDLEEDDELINFQGQDVTTHLEKHSLDDFDDETTYIKTEESLPKTEARGQPIVDTPKPTKKSLPKTSKREIKKNPVVEVEYVLEQKPKRKFFERDFIKSYIQKVLSFSVVLPVVDIVNHSFKYFDGIDVLKLENFSSIYLADDVNTIIIKGMMFLLFVYFITSNDGIIADSKGVFCVKNSVTGNFFLNTESVFVDWSEIHDVKLKYRLFEPYLHFYDASENEIGMLNFCLEDEKEFCQFIQESSGKKHPLYKLLVIS
jgi:hypothetical protein